MKNNEITKTKTQTSSVTILAATTRSVSISEKKSETICQNKITSICKF